MSSNFDRDLVQCHLVSEIFRDKVQGGLALKGGFAMRVAHGSSRLTKDIDLSADPSLSMGRLQQRIRQAIASLKKSGLVDDVRFSEPKQTECTQRWKISGMVGGNELHLTVEVSRRQRLNDRILADVEWAPPTATGLPPVVVRTINASAIAAAKVECVAGSSREAPRDVYDLFVLIKSQVYPPVELLRGLGPERIESNLNDLWTRIEAIDYQRVRTELMPFLTDEEASLLTEERWDEIRCKVGDQIQLWLKQAHPDPDFGMEDEMRMAGP